MKYESESFGYELTSLIVLCTECIIIGALILFALMPKCAEGQNRNVVYTNSHSSRAKLIQYVYRHSNKIDRSTARHIVDEVLETKHPLILLSLMKAESDYNPSAVSRKGARGIGQVMWTKELKDKGVRTPRDLFNIHTNVRAMEYVYDKKLKRAHGNRLKAVEYYFGAHNSKYLEKVVETYMRLED